MESDQPSREGDHMRYRKISVQIWTDAKFRSLSDDGQLFFLFVLTHPHMTSVGAMLATLPGLAAEKGWTEERLLKAFQEASGRGLLRLDSKACCLFAVNFIKHNPPESPNVVMSWFSALELVPECSIKIEVIQRLKEQVDIMGEGFRKAFGRLSEGLSKGMPNQEQEQEQEQNKEIPLFRSRFEDFWNVYPKRNGKLVGKKECLDFWNTHFLKSEQAQSQILQASANYKDCQQVKKGFVKDPIRFLRKDFWKDWLTPEINPVPEVESEPDPYGHLEHR